MSWPCAATTPRPTSRASAARTSTKIDAGASAWSFVLQPSGKVDVLCRIHRVNDRTFVLDTDAGWGQALLDRLLRFKLRVKVDLDRVALADDRGARAGRARARSGGAGQLVGRAGRRRPPGRGRRAAAGSRGRGRRRPRAPASRSGVAGHGVRAHHRHDPGRGRRGADRRELHQGLLHGPGARGAHRQPGRQRARVICATYACPAPSPRRPATASNATARTWDGSRSVAGDLALGYVARSVEPPATVLLAGAEVRVEAITP